MTLETRDVISSTVSTPYGVSGFVDNLLFMRFVEERGKVRRLLSITKMRDSDFDVGVHAFEIGSQGMRIAGLFTSDGDVIPSAQRIDPPHGAGQGTESGPGAKQS
jgi:circadian clock protein KaiC